MGIKAAMIYVALMMIIKSLAGILALKVQASVLLPSSFAILSQFMTITGLVTNISSAVVTSGMTVLLARTDSSEKAYQLIQSGKLFSIAFSCLISICCIALFFYGVDMAGIKPLPSYLFLILAIVPWLVTNSSIVQAQLTSSYNLNQFSKLSNISTIVVAILIIAFTYYFGLLGSAIAVAIGPMIIAGALLLYANKKKLGGQYQHLELSHSYNISELLRFSLIMLIAICAVPLSQILVRGYMVDIGAAEQAGYWSATLRLSDVYMQFFGLILTFYILPKVSSQTAQQESKRLFTSLLSRVVLVSVVVLSCGFLFREYIISLALAPEFKSVSSLLRTQLLADFFRIISCFLFWFSYGQNLRVLAATEEVCQACLFFLFFKIMHYNDAHGAVYAHLYASVANTIFIGICVFIIISRRHCNEVK